MTPDHPKLPNEPVFFGIKGFRFSGLIYLKPIITNTITIDTFNITITPFTHADSLVPLMSIKDITTTMNTAGRLKKPWMISPLAAVTESKGVIINSGGSATPNDLNNSPKYPAQLDATVAAPTAYSKTRSQPIIHAINSPIVA